MDDGAGAAEPASGRLIDEFCDVTSASREEAQFYLESHNWALDAAVLSFYDAAAANDEPDLQRRQVAQPSAEEPERAEEGESDDGGEDDDEDYVPPEEDTESAAAATGTRRRVKRQRASGSGGRLAVRSRTILTDLKGPDGSGSDGDDDGDDDDDNSDEDWKPQDDHANTGIENRDPSKRVPDADSVFRITRQMGAQQGQYEAQPQSSQHFMGIGRLLSGETTQASQGGHANIVHDVYFWSNGFTVNNGPLRRFEDPVNASFLESIAHSECPEELNPLPADGKPNVHVNLVRKEGKYPEPARSRGSAAFQGKGIVLGSGPSDDSVSTSANVADAVTLPTAAPGFPEGANIPVDDSLPSTSIQLRLADGTRTVARFNMHHTVGDVRAFINTMRPGAGAAQPYKLQTVGFPPSILDDVTKTIDEAGIANSVVIQKI